MDVKREQEDFCQELEKVAASLVYLINVRLNGTDLAEDIYQETVLSAWANRHTLKNKNLFKPWIYQIARYKCNDYYRKVYKADEKVRTELSLDIVVNRFGKRGSVIDIQKEILNSAINELNPEDKELISMFYYKGLKLSQIAINKQIPLGTAKRKLHNARNRLRKQIRERDDYYD